MHGEGYMGYSRSGKIVEHEKIRNERTMKPRCSIKNAPTQDFVNNLMKK